MDSPRWRIVMKDPESGEESILEATHSGTGFSITPRQGMVVAGLFMRHPTTGEEHIIGGSDWKVEVSLEAEGDMILAAQECPIEVGGKHQVLIEREDKIFKVPQIWVPSQVCSGGGFHLAGVAEYEAMIEAQAQGHDWSEFRIGQWHSHIGGFARLSGIDLNSTQEHMELFQHDWVHSGYRWRDREIQIEFVVNNRGDISARFSSAVPIIMHFPLEVVRVKGVTDQDVAEYMEENRSSIHDLVFDRVMYGGVAGMTPVSLSEYMTRRRTYELTEDRFFKRDIRRPWR